MVDAIPAGGDAPILEYPRRWAYKVIGRVEAEMRDAIAGVVEGRAHTLEYSRASAKGNFVSLLLELVVEDEGDRNAIFASLTEHAAVVMVI